MSCYIPTDNIQIAFIFRSYLMWIVNVQKVVFPWWCHCEVVECVRDGTQWERGLLVTEVYPWIGWWESGYLVLYRRWVVSSPMSCFPIGLLPTDLKVMRQLDHWLETKIKPALLSKIFLLGICHSSTKLTKTPRCLNLGYTWFVWICLWCNRPCFSVRCLLT